MIAYIAMLAGALGFVALVLLDAAPVRAGLTYRAIFALGWFAAAVGLVARLWERRILAIAMGALQIGLGVATATTLLPLPALAPVLQAAGVWAGASTPSNEGWSYLAMALGDMACGLGLLLSGSRRTAVAFACVTTVRTYLWGGAFWQLAHTMLRGDLVRLFEGPGRAVAQVGLVVTLGAAGVILFRGDRGWLRTFYAADARCPLSRCALPLSMVPVIVAYATSAFIPFDSRDGAAFALLNVEIISTGLALAVLTGARIGRGWRPLRNPIQDALQSAPAMVMSEDEYIEYWTEGCVRLYGFTAEEAVGRHAPTLLATDHGPAHQQIISAAASLAPWSGEVTQSTRDGRRLRIFLRLAFHETRRAAGAKIVATMTELAQSTPYGP